MRVDSLVRLRSMVHGWRRQKKSAREAVPEDLMERARRAAVVHGVGAVIRATGIQHRHLGARVRSKVHVEASGKGAKIVIASPSYSRIELPVAAMPTRVLAEAESPSGVKIRVFVLTPETLGLLSALGGLKRMQ